MKSLLIQNIGQLLQVREQSGFIKGQAMSELPLLTNAWLLIEGENIAAFGQMESCPDRADQVVDAHGGTVLPAWCDSHTHLVYAASREGEFVDRIRGLSYAEIAKKGGGILNSALRLQQAPEEELYEQAWKRLQEIRSFGTGAVEIKSGYGLSREAEMKMLRVIRRLKENSDVEIKATFLGAHALPMSYRENREAYLKLMLEEVLPEIAGEGLADYIDVFCEKNFFSVMETEKVMEAGAKYGLRAKIHVNQFNCMGGIAAAVKHDALSVDHLEVVNEEDIAALAGSETIPTLLPSAPFFLNDHYPPARKLIEAGLGVALATDYNPGTTPSGKMSFVLSLACIKMKMLPSEAINAATINGACALEMQDKIGSIAVGKLANLIVTDRIPSYAFLPYAFGSDLINQTILRGQLS